MRKHIHSLSRFFGRDYFAFLLACVSCVSLVILPLPVNAADLPAPAAGAPAPSGVGANCDKGIQQMKKACVEDPQLTGLDNSMLDQVLAADSMNSYGGQLSSAAANASNVSAQTAVNCESAGNSCKQACDQDAQKETNTANSLRSNPMTAAQATVHDNNATKLKKQGEQCKGMADQLAGTYAQSAGNLAQNAGQAAGTEAAAQGGSGKGGEMLMGGLLGAGLAVGAMCLMGSICKKDDKDKAGTDGDEDDSGEDIDCAKDEGAAQHASCQDHFLDQCEANPASPECEDFAGHYCGLGGSSGSTDEETAPTSTAGEGKGSYFCDIVLATRFCGDSAKENCPSCLNLARMNSSHCLTNPVQCLPQMTIEDKKTAQVVCPTDPLFANPTFIADMSSDSAEPDADDTSAADGTSIAIQSSAQGSTTTAAVPSSSGVGSTSGVGAYIKKFAKGVSDSVTGNGSENGAGSFSSGAEGVGNALRGTASSISEGVGSLAAGARQLASDIAPSVGPSLFTRVSKAIGQKCQAGKFNNCGPRSFTSN